MGVGFELGRFDEGNWNEKHYEWPNENRGGSSIKCGIQSVWLWWNRNLKFFFNKVMQFWA